MMNKNYTESTMIRFFCHLFVCLSLMIGCIHRINISPSLIKAIFDYSFYNHSGIIGKQPSLLIISSITLIYNLQMNLNVAHESTSKVVVPLQY